MDWTQRIGRRLKPRDLSIFMVVVEKQNMALAADHLAISRPVVSKTISDLERTLGVQLFDRFPHGVEPTLYGRALFKRSSAIFDELRQSVEELDFLADPRTGELRIATTEALSAGLIAATIDRLVRRFPRWTFQSVVSGVGTRTELLRSRQVELVVARQYAHDASISAETLFFDRLLVVAGPTSIWARQRKITLADLVEAPWIQARHEIEPGAPTYEAFRRLGLEVPEVKILSDSIDLRYGLLAKGDFSTLH